MRPRCLETLSSEPSRVLRVARSCNCFRVYGRGLSAAAVALWVLPVGRCFKAAGRAAFTETAGSARGCLGRKPIRENWRVSVINAHPLISVIERVTPKRFSESPIWQKRVWSSDHEPRAGIGIKEGD